MSKYFKKLSGLGLALGLAMGVASGANATSFNVSSITMDPSSNVLTGTVHNNSPLVNENALIGRILLTGTDSAGNSFTFDSFCVDIFNNLTAPATFSGGTLSALGLTTAQNNELTKLLANVDSYISAGTSSLDTAARSAAAQMAIWEIVNETTGTLDVDGSAADKGTFYVSGLSSSAAGTALADAAQLIANVTSGGIWYNNGSTTQVAIVSSNGNQTQVVYGANAARVLAAIPEAGTWSMMILGFGVVGASLRRKRAVEGVIA